MKQAEDMNGIGRLLAGKFFEVCFREKNDFDTRWQP